ncbi:probable aquaporin NIP7-1 isoform X2 [Cryptomeria japonica]|uniref:probable aquaporin NIP7-1 isoform X2 n=1 Tax=Cryptomeria japonica TaxID=3369 RepID=UPI0027DA03AF|nr:probable aquaporin NIP7-1 isoform X2 [Cryptomeria japonica]
MVNCKCNLREKIRVATAMMKETMIQTDNQGESFCRPCTPAARFLRRFFSQLRFRPICAEIVGTFVMTFSICAVIAVGKILPGGIGLMEYAATGAFAIMVVVFSIGHISGAHVNPAVTIAFAAAGQFPWPEVPCYVLAQFTSAIFATFAAKMVYGVEGELATTKPSAGCAKAFWVEFIASFFIMLLASALSIDASAIGQLAGIAVGASIAMGVLITAPVSGGSMNPARSFGPAVVSNDYEDIWVYLAAPTAGALLASILYKYMRIQHQQILPTSSPSQRNSLN